MSNRVGIGVVIGAMVCAVIVVAALVITLRQLGWLLP